MKKFDQLSTVKISDTRNVVISKMGQNGFTIAQQLCIGEGNSTTCMFLKGGIHITDVETLKSLRDALNIAIHEAEAEREQNYFKWDE